MIEELKWTWPERRHSSIGNVSRRSLRMEPASVAGRTVSCQTMRVVLVAVVHRRADVESHLETAVDVQLGVLCREITDNGDRS